MDVKYFFSEHVTDSDKQDFKRICERELSRTEHFFDGLREVALTLKTYEREGGRQKYSLHLKFSTKGVPIVAEDVDWKLNDVTHKVFDALHSQVAE